MNVVREVPAEIDQEQQTEELLVQAQRMIEQHIEQQKKNDGDMFRLRDIIVRKQDNPNGSYKDRVLQQKSSVKQIRQVARDMKEFKMRRVKEESSDEEQEEEHVF